MNKALKSVVLIGILLTLVLTSACTLRASKPPALQPTATSELLFLSTATTVAGAVATQTAAVQPAVATATTAPEQPAQPAGGSGGTTDTQTGGGQTVTQPQPKAQPAVTVPTIETPSTYTIQKGEWPICIARRFNLNLSSFFAANGLNMNSRPGIGTVMKTSGMGNWDASAHGARALRAHTDYKVSGGETVYGVACYFGDVTPEAILAVNGLSSASDIKAGMTLKIP